VRAGREDAVQPRLLVLVPRRRKCRARELLGVEPVRRLLWRVVAYGQCAGDGFSLVLAAKAILVAILLFEVKLRDGHDVIGRGVEPVW